MNLRRIAVSAICVSIVCAHAATAEPTRVESMAIVMPPTIQAQSIRVVNILFDRIMRRTGAEISITRYWEDEADLHIIIGQTDGFPRMEKLTNENGVTLPGGESPFPESFTLKQIEAAEGPMIVALGADERGVLYAAGELIRQFSFLDEAIDVPEFDVSSAPAYRYRGFSANQGGTMVRTTGARGWTTAELFEVVEDYALAGANVFYVGRNGGELYDYVKALGLMTHTDCRPNEYREEYPESWAAQGLDNWEGDHWLCPNVPAARQKLLETWEADFAQRPPHDIFRMYSGDPGGCRCENCMPWGESYVYLCEKVANIWLNGHPDSIVLIANQDLTNEGDQAIFDYLNVKPRDWLYGLAYGPGSNAMSDYFRDELRDDLFAYAGTGAVNRYLRETLHQLPAQQKIVHYSDITHWISAQYEVENPNPYIARVFGRRTFHARPKAFYKIFQDIMPFSEGDIIYSEGYHDEFHQYMWARLLWNPNQSLDDVMTEYCELYFGEDAAPLMRQALYLLEENIEADLVETDGIEKYYGLVTAAGKRIPERFMADDHRWHLHMQKGVMDKFVQERVQKEHAFVQGAFDALREGLADGADFKAAAAKARTIISTRQGMSFSMGELLNEAKEYGDISNDRHGVRNIGPYRLDRQLVDLQLVRTRIAEIESMDDAAAAKESAQALLDGGIPVAPYRW